MPSYESTIDAVKELKKVAKARRDRNKFEQAIKDIEQAIEQIKAIIYTPSLALEKVAKLKVELADCYGILGGIYRRWGLQEKNDPESQKEKFKLSYRSYDDGFKVEEEENTPPNSYNMVNRLVSRIFFKPEWLQSKSEETADKQNLKKQLETAENEVQKQLQGERRRDVWALADLATVRVLLNEEDPEIAFSSFVDEAPPSYAYTILLDTLKPLSELNIDAKENLAKAVHYLESESQ